jgi:hypothetical protein
LTWDVKKLMERDMVSAFASKKDGLFIIKGGRRYSLNL